MKFREIKNFIKNPKTICLFLTITSISSLTACSFNFTSKAEPSTEHNLTEIHLEDEISTEVGKIIEYTDFTNEEETEEMVDAVRGTADIVENENELEFEKATLVRVVDGDTIVVEINDNEYKVRLIGINTPESVAPDSYRVSNSEEGVLASEYTKNLLSNVTEVYLQKDTSETDRYGRLLRYVWLEMPEDSKNINEIATKMLNGLLLLDNVAEVATYEPDTEYQEEFEYIASL